MIKLKHILKKILIESGFAGADRIQTNDIKWVTADYIKNVLSRFPLFNQELNDPPRITGSFNSATKPDAGDIDLIVYMNGEDKKNIKQELVKFFESFPTTILGFSKNPKYLNKRTSNVGELVSVRYIYKKDGIEKSVQIDNFIAISKDEFDFKHLFLNFPVEKIGLILGLIKILFMENDSQKLFNIIGFTPKNELKMDKEKQTHEEFEFNINSSGLQLRLINYDLNFKRLKITDLWTTTNWTIIEKLLSKYNLSVSFDELYDQIDNSISNSLSRERIAKVFSSLVGINSGEVGTPKAENKQRSLDKVSLLVNKIITK